jgi:hypothetical protein
MRRAIYDASSGYWTSTGVRAAVGSATGWSERWIDRLCDDGVIATEADPERPGRRRTACGSVTSAALADYVERGLPAIHAARAAAARDVRAAKSCTVFSLDDSPPTDPSSGVVR